jgi:hypothetical protein
MLARLKDWVGKKQEDKAMTHLEVNTPGSMGQVNHLNVYPSDASSVRALLDTPGATGLRGSERPRILVVGKDNYFSDCVIDYSVQLAQRLSYDILAMNVGAAREEAVVSPQQVQFRETFTRRAQMAAENLKHKAAQRGVHCDHAVKFMDVGLAVEELYREVKRIEFVVTDSQTNKEEIAAEVTLPVFNVIPTNWSEQGGRIMAQETVSKRNRPLGKTLIFGAGSVALYAAVFANSSTITQYFSQGGWYAALPIATVFAFSYVHGSFASNLWSLLGIEARKREALQPRVEQTVQPRKQPRKRPRAHAYVNPWHRM